MKKRQKRIALLVVASMVASFFPVNSFVSASEVISPPVIAENMKYLDFFNGLTTFINQKVGKDTSNNILNNYLNDPSFEKAIAQRELLRSAGISTIEGFIATPEKKEFINWLFNNTEAMNLFLEGGKPDTEYSKAFEVWFEIWSKDPASHTGYELKLAIACAMKFGNGVPKWYTSRTLVTPYERYEYFKVREAQGKFPVSMKTRTVWELRNTINAPTSNADLDYVREVIHKDRYNATNKTVSVWYPPYVSTSPYKDENGNPYSVFSASGDQFFGPNATIKEVHEIGGVCGTASMFGSITVKSFGIPGFLIGQPGHAAHVYHSPTSYGKWDIGYDVFGWGESSLGESTLVPYTNYNNIFNRVAYWFAYEESRVDESALHKSYELKWIADALSDYNKAQEVRKLAKQTNKWNIDVWRDYINSMGDFWNEGVAKTQIPTSLITSTATSENRNYTSQQAIDGNSKTFWHTQYDGQRSVLPQSITLAFDKQYEISKFSYVPRQDGGKNGNITEYNLYTSLDGINYEKVSHGTWANNSNEKTIEFKTTNAKYIKLEALKGEGNYASASELKVYEPLTNKPITQAELDEVANSIINDLQEQPEVVYDLFRLIQDKVLNSETSREKYQQYIVDLNEVLDKYSKLNWKTKQIADSLKKSMPGVGLYLADFNFDGENAGRLVGSKTDSEYSLDGGSTWKTVKEENMKLSEEELTSITEENGIRVRIAGTNEYILIPIYKAPSLPKVYTNDDINKIFNMNTNVYYSVDDGATWTKFENEDKLPDLSGDFKFMVRIPAQGKTLGSEIQTFEFTSKVDNSLILPSGISSVKGDAHKNNPVEYAYDGNIHTFWHSDYEGTAKPLPQSLIFELKEASNIYKLQYVPRQDGGRNGTITEYNIYTSIDGENFKLISNGKWADDDKTKTAIFNAKNIKYVKFEATKGVGNYASAAEIKLFKTDKLIPQISFNLDGENEGKIIGSNTDMEYSMDNGKTWNDITKVNMPLTSDELRNINPNTIIKVRFKNTDEAAEISFAACSKNLNVLGDDIENTITGLDNTMEYSIDNGITWVRYNETFNVDLRGNVVLHVRTAATGTTLAGCDVVLNYTTEFDSNFKEGVVYKFISKATGRSFDVAGGSGAEDAEVIQYGYGGSRNQIAYLVSVGDNEYKIVMKHSGKVLSPQKLSSDDGAKLAQTTYNNLSAQKWKLVKLGDNEYQIINVGTGYAITADNNRSTIKNSKLDYSNNQIWSINYVHDVLVPDVNFSFDGDNAGRIMGTSNSMQYSLDNGKTWKSINAENMLLPNTDLESISAEHGIKVRVNDNAGIAEIKINNRPIEPNVSANDKVNVISGIDSSMEYSDDNGRTWTRYSESNSPNFTTDITVLVRIAGKGVTPPSNSKKLDFTTKITIPLYKEFNPVDHIATKDSQGNDITSSIKIIKNTVDINKRGIYLITYKTIDADNNETTITREVEVTSIIDYLSDINYKSGTCGWGSIKKDTNLNSSINNGSIVLHSNIGKEFFKKGITAHANSELIYDISNKQYTNFESYVGVDDAAYNTSASVIFKVYVDGILKYDSKIVSSKMPYKYVNVDIKGAKEIKLIVDSNGTNSYDHSVWADAKFISTDSAPKIDAANVSYEKDEVVNLDEIVSKVKASDVEDGDLTSKVTYTTNYQKGSTGNFDIVYSVVDSDGNKTEKTVKLIVVNSSIYVSDTEWSSASTGWGSIHKDLTLNAKSLRLWDGEKEVTYEKGIGTHAHSEIVYNLTDKDYGYFTSYVGGDRDGNNNTSVKFKVYVDGKLVKETDIMKRDTTQEFIKVNIAGAKQLKLVVEDGGNGNGNDSAIWGDAKFLMASDKAGEVVVKYVDINGNKLKEDKVIQVNNSYDVASDKLSKIIVGDKTYSYKLTIGQEKGDITQVNQKNSVIYTYELTLDTFNLKEAIKKAELLKEGDYETASWVFLEEKLSIAKTLLSNEKATQVEVDKVCEAIKLAISNLQKFNGQSPVINAEDVTYKEGDEVDFNDILSKVEVIDAEDGNISSKITYTTNYVKNKVGDFEIVYTIVDSNNNTTTKTVKLIVTAAIEDFTYVSDLEWTDAYSGRRRVQKDKSVTQTKLKLWDGTKEVVYEKGIGTHSYSEVAYDLAGKNFKNFTSSIGVSRDANNKGSVIFKVFVDDKLAYTSNLMNKNTKTEFIKINIEGASRVKLVVEDGGNGSGNDHANWADAKFIK